MSTSSNYVKTWSYVIAMSLRRYDFSQRSNFLFVSCYRLVLLVLVPPAQIMTNVQPQSATPPALGVSTKLCIPFFYFQKWQPNTHKKECIKISTFNPAVVGWYYWSGIYFFLSAICDYTCHGVRHCSYLLTATPLNLFHSINFANRPYHDLCTVLHLFSN